MSAAGVVAVVVSMVVGGVASAVGVAGGVVGVMDVVESKGVAESQRVPSPPGEWFVPPTAAAISERFDHDAGAYGPGNRGLDFATAPGDEVRAIGDGVVTFSGPVAGDVWVTVQHPNGLRSTVGPMRRSDVVAGERVRRGQVVGTVRAALHLSIREGERYLDPEPLLWFGRLRAVLVPVPSEK